LDTSNADHSKFYSLARYYVTLATLDYVPLARHRAARGDNFDKLGAKKPEIGVKIAGKMRDFKVPNPKSFRASRPGCIV
jgi:hypothetical protein